MNASRYEMGRNGQSPKPTMPLISVNSCRPIPRGRKSRAAVAQFAPSSVIADNIAHITALATEAKATTAPDILVFPELSLTGLEAPHTRAEPLSTTNLDTPYPTNIVRRKDLVVMRQPHHYQPFVKWHQ